MHYYVRTSQNLVRLRITLHQRLPPWGKWGHIRIRQSGKDFLLLSFPFVFLESSKGACT